VRRKLNPLHETINGKRFVVVDDSIVARHDYCAPIIRMLREAGAAEVHLRISFRLTMPCYFGIDTPVAQRVARRAIVNFRISDIWVSTLCLPNAR